MFADKNIYIYLPPNYTPNLQRILVKRFFAILLLSVHLFYAGGYTLFFQYFIHRSETQMVKQIYENKVDATQLVQIKIPVHMPQMQDWPDYEHVQGQVQLKR
jgi:hypothetical protein